MDTPQLLERFQSRLKPRLALRLIPKSQFTGNLGPVGRHYVCLADYEELQGMTVREAVERIYGGRWEKERDQQPRSIGIHGYHFELDANQQDALQVEAEDSYFVVALNLEDDREVDFFPGTWKALAFIATDPSRMSSNWEHYQQLLDMHGGQKPFETRIKRHVDFYGDADPTEGMNSPEQKTFYGYLAHDSAWCNELFSLFGVYNRCWHGGGYVGSGGEMLCRVFLGKNLPLSHQAVESCELLRLDDMIPVRVEATEKPHGSLAPSDEKKAVLRVQAGLQYFQMLKDSLSEGTSVNEAMYQLFADATNPFKVARFEDTPGKVEFVVDFMYGHGMEETLWLFKGEHRERDAIKLSIVMRNLYYSGARDARDGEWPFGIENTFEGVHAINQDFSLPKD